MMENAALLINKFKRRRKWWSVITSKDTGSYVYIYIYRNLYIDFIFN